MESTRQLKIARLLQKELGTYFLIEGRTLFGKAMITVTQIGVTKDLSIARVFLSIYNVDDKNAIVKNVQQHTKAIRYAVGQKVKNQLRIIPELEFKIDDSLDYIEHIDELLKK